MKKRAIFDLRRVLVLALGERSRVMPDVYRWRFNFMVSRTTIWGKSVEFPCSLEIAMYRVSICDRGCI
jgi:hypothetical protein